MPRDLLKEIQDSSPSRDLLAEIEASPENRTLFLEDISETVTYPLNSDLDEVGNTVQREVYNEDLENPTISETLRKAKKSIGLGIIQPILSSPSEIGSLLREFGETFITPPTLPKRLSTIATVGLDPKLMVGFKKFIVKQTGIDKFLAEKGKQVIAHNRRFLDTHNIRPEEGKVNEFLFNLGSGVTSLAGAIAITKLTGNPNTAAAVFGVSQKARIFEQAREAGIEPTRAQELSTIAGVLEAGLEYIGLDLFFKSGGNAVRRFVMRSFIEGSQEMSQEIASNVVVKLGGINEAQKIFDGVIQAGTIGAILGGGASVVLTPFEKKGLVNELKAEGLTEEEAIKTIDSIEKNTDIAVQEELKQFGLSETQLEQETKEIEKAIAEGKVEPIKEKPKPKTFTERIQEIREKFKKPETILKQEVKSTQEEIIRELEASELEPADKAKFIKTIKNVQTPQQLESALPKIEQRIVKLEQAQQVRTLRTQISKELKTTKPLKVGQKRVGKFDPESNRVFDTLRTQNKLSQEKAQTELDKFAEEPDNELDLLKKRFSFSRDKHSSPKRY